jgi:hypothetical protein
VKSNTSSYFDIHISLNCEPYIYCFEECVDLSCFNRYEVITTPTDIIMVIEYAGRELFNYIVEKGKVKCMIDYSGLILIISIDG